MSLVDDLKRKAKSVKIQIQNPIVIRPPIIISNVNKTNQHQKRKKVKEHQDQDEFFYNDLSYTVKK